MTGDVRAQPAWPRWTSRLGTGLSALVVLFLLMDAGFKLMQLPVVLTTMRDIGWPAESVVPPGLLLLASTVLYAVPRTSMLGAVLLTAYLGGAVATHARIGSPLFTHVLFGVYLGLLVWIGLFLRNAAARKAVGFTA